MAVEGEVFMLFLQLYYLLSMGSSVPPGATQVPSASFSSMSGLRALVSLQSIRPILRGGGGAQAERRGDLFDWRTAA